MVLRFGFRTGKSESFAAIGRELGDNRIRAQAIFRNAIQRLDAQDGTRGLARYLADLNAVLSEEEPAERASRPVPAIEDIDEVMLDDVVDALEIDRGAPAIGSASSDAAAPIGAVDQDEPADREDEVTDEPVSERDALKLVRVADRELARAIEQCAGREDLLAELQRARTRIAAGMREIELAPVEKPVVVTTGKRRGRPANVRETARRVTTLERVQAGTISNAEAAAELGIAYGTWTGWKALHAKRSGVAPAPIARASWEPTSVATGRPAADAAKLVARVEELERIGRELRERIRALVRLVEGWLQG